MVTIVNASGTLEKGNLIMKESHYPTNLEFVLKTVIFKKWKWWWDFKSDTKLKIIICPLFHSRGFARISDTMFKNQVGTAKLCVYQQESWIDFINVYWLQIKILKLVCEGFIWTELWLWDLPHPQWHRFFLSLVYQPASSSHAHYSLPFLFMIIFKLKTLREFFPI